MRGLLDEKVNTIFGYPGGAVIDIYDELIKQLLARPIKVCGTVLSDEFGLMMIGTTTEFISPRIKIEACSLLNSLGIETENEVWNHDQS